MFPLQACTGRVLSCECGCVRAYNSNKCNVCEEMEKREKKRVKITMLLSYEKKYQCTERGGERERARESL